MSDKEMEETLKQLLGVSVDYEDGSRGRNRNNGERPAEDAVEVALSAVTKLVRMAEKRNLAIDDFFRHEHYLYSCDGNGAYCIISLFTMAVTPPGVPVLSIVTSAMIRCHDNFRDSLFLPTREQHSAPYFQRFLEGNRNSGASDFRRVPYRLCSDLIRQSLERMKRANKFLRGKETRTVARLFGLSTRDTFHQVAPTLPSPSPAPNIESLWIVLHRPEYFYFGWNEDLYNALNIMVGSMALNPTVMKKAMLSISNDDYRRNRVYAMLEHMAVWHTVGGERQIASWLLWERAAMMNYSDKASAIQALESNIVFQLIINKFFDGGTGCHKVSEFLKLDVYGRGLTNYLLYQKDLRERGTLPPNVLVTASIAENAVASTADSRESNMDNKPAGTDVAISKLSKDVSLAKGGCALCGATTFKDSGGPLLECSICHSVAYCCRDHQVLHWKKGRHKQECMPDEV